MRRPGWWPRSWPWPGGGPTRPEEPSRGLPRAGARRAAQDPSETFLRTLGTAFGAERTTLYRLDRGRETWVPERSVAGSTGADDPPDELPARGHPLSWCLREELVAQLPPGELAGSRRAGGWTLVGPAPGSDRVLVLVFGGSPPAGARRAVEAARLHVAALEAAGVLPPGGEGEEG